MKKTIRYLFLVLTFYFLFASYTKGQEVIKVHLADGTSFEVYISDIQKITFSDLEAALPQELEKVSQLIKVYPNPASKLVKVKYLLEKSGDVKINIYNIKGSLIHDTVCRNCLPGSNIYNWDVRNSPPGIYICTIQHNRKIWETKIIVD